MTFPYLDDTATKHIVTLNGNEYVTVGAADIQEQPASEFAVQVAQGPPSQDTRENLSYWTMANWTPGLGIKFGDFREHVGRIWFETGLDGRFANQLTLGPLIQTLDVAQATGNTIALGTYGSYVTLAAQDYFAIADRVFRNDAGTLNQVLDVGTDNIDHLFVYSNSAGTTRIYAFTSSGRFWFSTTGNLNGWTQSDAGVVGRWAIEYRNNLILFAGPTGTVLSFSSVADGAAASYTTIVDFRNGSPTRGAVFLNVTGDIAPYIAVVDTSGTPVTGVYLVDFYTRMADKIDLQRAWDVASPLSNPPLNNLAVYDSALMIPDGTSLIGYEPGRAREVTAMLSQGLPASYGPIGMLRNHRGQLFMSLGTGTTHGIGVYNQVGWHLLYTTTTPIRGCYISTIQTPARLYWIEAASAGTAFTIRYIEFEAAGIGNPVLDTAYDYAATGYLITPWVDGGFADLDKILLRMRIRAADLTATETVVVDYQLDDSGADDSGWTNLGTFDDPADILRFGASSQGVGARSFRFRITLNRGTTTTRSPKVWALTLDFLITPEYRAADAFVVDLGATIRHRGEPYVSIATLMTEFETAYEAATLVTYAWGGDTATRVKVVSYKTSLHDLDVPDPQTAAIRDGLTQVQVMAVIA